MPSFYYAKEGINKIFAAQILSLISIIAGFIDPFLYIDGLDTSNKFILFGMYFFMLFTTIFSIVSYLLVILGCKTASKDHTLFKVCFYFSIANFASSFVNLTIQVLIILGILAEEGFVFVLYTTINIVLSILETLILILISFALKDLLNRRDEKKLSRSAFSTAVIGIITMISVLFLNIMEFTGAASLVSDISQNLLSHEDVTNAQLTLFITFIVVTLVSFVTSILVTVKFIALLSKSRKRLV